MAECSQAIDSPDIPVNVKLEVYNRLRTVDKKFTTPANIPRKGGKFTTINTQYMIEKMTAEYGPIGIGWGFWAEYEIHQVTEKNTLVIVKLTIWVEDRKNTYGPIMGTDFLVRAEKSGLVFVDDDAPKKAMSDALKKGMSMIGVCADVYSGKADGVSADDDKYGEDERIQKDLEDAAKAEVKRLRSYLLQKVEEIQAIDYKEGEKIRLTIENRAMSVTGLKGSIKKAESILADMIDNE